MAESPAVPFTHHGIVQRKDPALLAPGEYYQFENAMALQEGNLQARNGHKSLVVGGSAPIVSISKLNLATTDILNPRYQGTGTVIKRGSIAPAADSIFRVFGTSVTWIPGQPTFNGGWVGLTIYVDGVANVVAAVGSGTALTLQTAVPGSIHTAAYFIAAQPFTNVFTGLTNGQRWSAIQYNAGTAGTPALYFATANAAIRDNGFYTTLQKWGIDPPPVPVVAYPANPQYANVGDAPQSAANRFIVGVNSNAPDADHLTYNWKAITAIEVLSPTGAANGYTKITPDPAGPTNGLDGIYVGMQVGVGDPVTVFVEYTMVIATDNDSLYVWTTTPFPSANAPFLVSGETVLVVPGSTYNGFAPNPAYTFNAAYSGLAVDGYDSTDVFHFGIYFSNPSVVTKVSIQLVPNYTGAPYASDYYEYSVDPSTLSFSTNASTAEFWTEFAIPKTKFKKVGNAGTGPYNWSNLNQVYIVATGGASTVKVSGLFFVGGGGLNSLAAGTTPYDYLYVYRNPTTQAQGNPCPAMITANVPPLIANSGMQLLLTATAAANGFQSSGVWELSGPGSIKIYRRGGTFSDGFYRHVGYAANPGGGVAVPFVDNASDQSIATAEVIEFDNDPPVPANLQVPLTAGIAEFQPTGGGATSYASAEVAGGAAGALVTNSIVRVVLSGWPTNFPISSIAQVIAVGSTVQIGFGKSFEQTIVTNIGASPAPWFEAYLQSNHLQSVNPGLSSYDPSDTIEIDATLRGTCDLVHQDFDCLFLAGNTANPATLYQSKIGRPESFPIENFESKIIQQINVGSPSNPIYGITSLGPGELVLLNSNNIFIVQVWNGQMQQPVQAPASRGLYSKWCWCKGDNRIWYLAYDGIYTWAGGQSQKVSEAIDYMFKNQVVNGIVPIDFTRASQFSFAFSQNSLYAVVIDVNGVYVRLRYEVLYDRWAKEVIYAAATGPARYTIDSLFAEPDTGNLLVGVTNPGV